MAAEKVHFDFDGAQQQHIIRALAVYANDLRKQIKPVEDLGKQREADAWTAEARTIDDDLKARVRDSQEGVELTKKEIEVMRTAVGRYVKKMHKAANTLGGLFEAETADELREKATKVEQRTKPLFEEQQELGLAAATITKEKEEPEEEDDEDAGQGEAHDGKAAAAGDAAKEKPKRRFGKFNRFRQRGKKGKGKK